MEGVSRHNGKAMRFEEGVGQFNEYFFFREFTFSNNTFRPDPKEELELADNIIWLDNVLIVFQLKERKSPVRTTAEAEERWFNNKVQRQATRQMRNTLRYLRDQKEIELRNHAGHTSCLRPSEIDTIHKVVCYLADAALPQSLRLQKCHRSRTGGLVHLISYDDYLGIVRTLLTPPEVADYLSFRERVIERWEPEVAALPEQALVGQYLHGNVELRPSIEFTTNLSALDHRIEEWDMSSLIKLFPSRITGGDSTEYYCIVTEIAKLMRNELRQFKIRFRLAMEMARSGTFALPYRMACPRTECGFVFVPLVDEFIPDRQQGLINLTLACKYDLRLPKCIGVSFAPEDGGWYSVEWCYTESPWTPDIQLEKMLGQSNPFRDVRTKEIDRYDYSGDV